MRPPHDTQMGPRSKQRGTTLLGPCLTCYSRCVTWDKLLNLSGHPAFISYNSMMFYYPHSVM